jgi:hypothetical protein
VGRLREFFLRKEVARNFLVKEVAVRVEGGCHEVRGIVAGSCYCVKWNSMVAICEARRGAAGSEACCTGSQCDRAEPGRCGADCGSVRSDYDQSADSRRPESPSVYGSGRKRTTAQVLVLHCEPGNKFTAAFYV